MDILSLLVFFFSFRLAKSCTTAQLSGVMADRIAESDSVIWGYVVATEHDTNKSVNGLRVYTAEVRVKCVMKGKVLSRIKVVQLGDTAKRCVRVDLQLNENYILMLNKVGSSPTLYTADVKQDLFSRRRLDKVTGYCGLSLSQPMNEAYTEHGYVDCSSFTRQSRRKRPCTTLPNGPGENTRTKKEKNANPRPTTPRKNRLDTRQGDRPAKGASGRYHPPPVTQRPRTVVIRPRKSAAMTLRTRLYVFCIVIAAMFKWL